MGIDRQYEKFRGMKKLVPVFFALILMGQSVMAQTDSVRVYKIGLFLPLYLDSAFDASGNYKLGKGFPKQSISGLEFYEGAELALDSLQKEGAEIDFHVFDIRSGGTTINKVAGSGIFDSLDLIIGSVSGTEYLQLAGIAQQKNIPFVSATYPNDGGVTANPNVVIVNSKLNTHIQSLYNYMIRNFGTNKLVWFRRKNAADDRIADIFKQLNGSKSGGVLSFQTVILPDYFSLNDIAKSLDSVRNNVIIAGSLDETFGRNLAVACLGLTAKNYQINLVGMPTWEGIKDLAKTEFKPLPIIYSTTFFNSLTDKWSTSFESNYRKKTYSRPSDMAYRGFEITYYFSKLLQKYDTALIANLNDKSYKLLTDFEFKPITWSKNAAGPDYYENKRIYIVKRLNGTVARLN
jgi:ABC-type branched-subunit amino acid transport system substrate-binding protein